MSLRFRYQLAPVNHPVTPLAGRWVRPRPIIGVTVIGPADSRARDALLDTGSDDTVFPEELAAKIGVDLSNAPVELASGIGSAVIPLRYAEVTLRVTDGNELREWQGWVGFTPATLLYPTIGFAGFLQFFSALFHGDREEVVLTVNSLYRGT
jgi:hypothetical protein